VASAWPIDSTRGDMSRRLGFFKIIAAAELDLA
jgi:hypothetical protein